LARKTRLPILIGGGVALLLVAAFFFFRGSFAPAAEVDVATASLTYASQANSLLTASGYIVAQQKAAVASKGTGRLVYLGVEEGDRVKKGQIIARLEDQDVQAALASAKANHELAQADLQDATQWRDRQRKMFATNLSSQSDVDAAEARYMRVQATIKAAEAAIKGAEVSVSNTLIRAPFDGTVLTKSADVGEVVAPFAASAASKAAVVTLADMSSLQVEADVSESNITRVKAGQPCEIVLDAYPGVRYPGTVHKIVPTADRAKATVLTKVRFNKLDERVLPEMSAKVNFLSKELEASQAEAKPKLTVPISSVVTRDGKEVVLLVRENEVTETRVKTAESIGDKIVIAEGLSQGDQVLLRPDPGLKSGSKIKPKK
jgi:RND family efflux transporter MFP subunit